MPSVSTSPVSARRLLASFAVLVAALVWTHALAGGLRALAGVSFEAFAPSGTALTLAAAGLGFAVALALRSERRAFAVALVAAALGWFAVGARDATALVPAAALFPAGLGAAWLGRRLELRLPASLDATFTGSRWWKAAWVLVALAAVVQVGRLSTYLTDPSTDWFLSTRHPFFAKHECLNAYVYGAELHLRGEENVYDPAHYPGLNPSAEPHTEMVGMHPEDPYQYPPPFLLGPTLAIEITRDYAALRSLWFGLNVTLCLGAVVALAVFVGGVAGRIAGLAVPALLFSFPVLHDFQYGQFHFAAIAFAVLGVVGLERGYRRAGGAFLSMAILAKLFPAVLIVPLVVRRRWRDVASTAVWGAAITLVAWIALGSAPFTAFVGEHLPRLADGSAFAFGEAWPEVADVVTAGNQGIHGIVEKLGALGWVETGVVAPVARKVFALLLLGLGIRIGLRATEGRRERAVGWLGLIGAGSLMSNGAWADYVPLTCVWLLGYYAFAGRRSAIATTALVVTAVLQVFLLGAVPLGGSADGTWMIPVSLFGAVSLLATFVAAAWSPVPRSRSVPEASALAIDAAVKAGTR